jgi:hypothetical protein
MAPTISIITSTRGDFHPETEQDEHATTDLRHRREDQGQLRRWKAQALEEALGAGPAGELLVTMGQEKAGQDQPDDQQGKVGILAH